MRPARLATAFRTGALVVVLLGTTRLGAQRAPEWAGVWKGTLVNLPVRPGAAPVDITIELGPFPTADRQCAPWNTTYSEGGAVRGVKDYAICRGEGPNDLYVDEGNNVRLKANLLGDVLVSAFKTGSILLVTHLRVRGDSLEEEIITINDTPATDGLVTMTARSIQRLVATRQR